MPNCQSEVTKKLGLNQKKGPYLVPEHRKLPLFASEAKEVENYSVNHPIRQSILLVQDYPGYQEVLRHIICWSYFIITQLSYTNNCPKPNIRACH